MMGRPLSPRIRRPSWTFVPASRTTRGTGTAISRTACTTPSATQSQRLMPANTFTRIAFTLRSARTSRKAAATRSGLAPPPDVEEIGRLAPRVLDHVHRGHREPGAVDDAADIAV